MRCNTCDRDFDTVEEHDLHTCTVVSEVPDSLDQLVQAASVPNLAALFKKGKDAGLIKAGKDYGDA